MMVCLHVVGDVKTGNVTDDISTVSFFPLPLWQVLFFLTSADLFLIFFFNIAT